MVSRKILAWVSLIVSASVLTYLTWERQIDEPRPNSPIDGTTTPSQRDSSSKGRDIGLGFRVCRVTGVEGLDLIGDGSGSTGWTATNIRPDGRCNRSLEDSYFVALDVNGDGLADASSKPLRWCVFCRPIAATDLDADGDDELLVLEQAGSVNSYSFFEMSGMDGNWELHAIHVAEPGHPMARHAPGKPLRFWVGGDEGFSAAASCTGYPADPLLIVEWDNHPIEGPGSEKMEVHRTVLRLRDGAFRVRETSDTVVPTLPGQPSGLNRSRDVCGVDLSRPG
jgi:hypothetical protein